MAVSLERVSSGAGRGSGPTIDCTCNGSVGAGGETYTGQRLPFTCTVGIRVCQVCGADVTVLIDAARSTML